MNISKIELENFRQYKGKIDLEFNTDSKNNIAIILGEMQQVNQIYTMQLLMPVWRRRTF